MSNRKRRRRRSRPVLPILLAVILLAVGISALAPDKPDGSGKEALPHTASPSPLVVEEARYTLSPEVQETPGPVSRYADIPITEEDAYLLACLVYHEARGEPFEGQVAVVEVVFNRVLSDRFPDMIEEVVFQKYGKVWQFSPAPYIWTAEPSEANFNAVYVALNETEYNVTAETVYFSTAPYNDKISAIIGNHYFCEI